MINRRRALTILAGATLLPTVGAKANTWRGIALGAEARIVLDHPDAERLIAQSVAEIHRLEAIFSLYQPDSQLSRLNRDGVLLNPAFEMIELLSLCAQVHQRTNGAFDPTVQRLWTLYAQEYAQGSRPDAAQISHAMALTGWRHLRYSPAQISFDRAGMGLTMNGIAQGYIADKVTALLRREGVAHVMVNTGEIAALGLGPDGNNWRVILDHPGGQTIDLHNVAIATSAPYGTSFDQGGTAGHILDPRNGLTTGGQWPWVSVVAKSAALADGLSTGFCLMQRPAIMAAQGECQVYLG